MRMEKRVVKRALAPLAWTLIALIAGWLLWPALNPVHVEGFSASVVALGLHVAQGTVADFMPFAAFDADYFGLTKLGVVLGVDLLSPILGGDGAMRLIMIVSFVVFVAASADLVRRWTSARWIVIAFVLVLTPGVAESAFFYNDNVPAAALTALALAVLNRARSWPLAIITGLLIGCAIAIRTDVVLLAVTAAPLIAWKREGLRRGALSTVIAGAAALAVLVAIFAAVHSSPLDAIRAGAYATKLWNRPAGVLLPIVQFVYFCGLPSLVLILLGIFELRRRRDWRTLALLTGVPLACCAVLVESLWETRQFLTYTPFLCGLAALGVESAMLDLRVGRRFLPALLGVFVLLVLAAPPLGVVVSDGPRELLGRLGGIGLWNNWQVGVRHDLATVEKVVTSLRPGRLTAVLTDGWDDDRYLHLELVEGGFRRSTLPPACDLIGEGMSRADRTLVQLTLLQSFVPYWPALQPQRLEQGALPCLAAVRPTEIILLGRKARIDALLSPRASGRPLGPDISLTRSSPVIAVPLDSNGLAMLDKAYRREATALGQTHDLREANATVASRSAFSRPSGS